MDFFITIIIISNIYIYDFHTNYHKLWGDNMMVGKSVSVDLNDLNRIQKRIENGESSSLSEFVRNAIKNELRR
ncbi:MAG: ribbon-helix-helix protein, CopG family [Methanobacterium sp.]|nr:MAG: ribbon-helix-helix protein, CopG family [Methanobacterium sp.]